MKFVITSDVHIHNWSHNATLKNGINSRLWHTWQRLNDVIEIGKIEKVDGWLNAGDWLHTKKIDGEVLDVAARAISNCPFPIYSIYGNHDLVSSVQEIGSARAFSGKITYLDGLNGNVVKLADGTNLVGISFHSNRAKLVNFIDQIMPDGDNSILMLHQGIVGAQMAEGFVADTEDCLIPKDLLDRAGIVISGHFHSAQYVDLTKEEFYKMTGPATVPYTPYKTTLIPGALEQHNWGDTGQERGCWILDTTVHTVQFIPLSSPKFIVADEKTDPKTLKGNYVKWVSKVAKVPEELVSGMESMSVEIPMPEVKVQSHAYHLNLTDGTEKILAEYVANNKLPNLDSERLMKEGRRLLCS